MKKILFFLMLTAFFRVQAESLNYGVGANVDSAINENKLNYLRFNGINVFRVSFANNQIFFIKNNKIGINEKSWEDLNKIINWARGANAKLILDPHYFPCMGYKYSTRVDDELWGSATCKKLIIELWLMMARRLITSRDVFLAYDLINEPSYNEGGEVDFLGIYGDLIREIRKIDDGIVLLVQPPIGLNSYGVRYSRVDGLKYLDINWAPNVHLSVHMYLRFHLHIKVSGAKEMKYFIQV